MKRGFFMFTSWKNFITWEESTHDSIDVKKTYIDAADDIMAGILLSQIVYWYLPNKEGKSKLRVKKDGHFWIAKKRDEWYEEIRFTEANYKTSIKKLVAKDLVVKERFKFDGAPTTHIRLNIPAFLKSINELMESKKEKLDDEISEFDAYLEEQMEVEAPSPLDSVESTEWKRLNQPNGSGRIDRMDLVESTESLTEITTEIFTENTTKNLSIQEVENSDLSTGLKKYLLDPKQIDRLIDLNISVSDIENNYLMYKDEVSTSLYINALDFAFQYEKIGSLKAIMRKNINTLTTPKNKPTEAPKPKEVVPGWFKPREEQQQDTEFAADQNWSKKEIEDSVQARLDKKKKDAGQSYDKEDIATRIEKLKAAHS